MWNDALPVPWTEPSRCRGIGTGGCGTDDCPCGEHPLPRGMDLKRWPHWLYAPMRVRRTRSGRFKRAGVA
jgi:hypothetical protein